MGADMLIASIGFKAMKDRFEIDEQWAIAAFVSRLATADVFPDVRWPTSEIT